MDKTLIFNFAAAMLSIVNPFGNLPCLLGEMGIEIATRLLGLILAAIGVQFILNGLANATVGLINPEVTR
jgi:small neutral amino acid transporter SnatA (MarC family)